MSEHVDPLRRLDELATRRSWLLYKALECLPLDQAIDLARAAKAFVAESPVETEGVDAALDPETPAALPYPAASSPTMMYPATRPKIPHRQTELA